MHGVDRAVRCGCGECGPERGVGHAETCLLALHVTAGLVVRAHVHRAVGRKLRRSDLFEEGYHCQARHQHHEHGREDSPALSPIGHEATEAEHERERDEQQRDTLHQVRERRGVFQGARRVHAIIASAVRSELLDGNLAGLRPHGHHALIDHLHGCRIVGFYHIALCIDTDRFQQLYFLIFGYVLRRALPHVHHGHDERERDEHEKHGARHVDEEVAQARGAFAHQPAEQREQHGHAHGRCDEVLHGQADGLGEVAERALAAIGLPVRVRHEADRRVEREVPREAGEPLGIARQHALQHEDGEQPCQRERRERQRAYQVAFPAHDVGTVDADAPVHHVLHRHEHTREHGHPLAGHDLVDIARQRDGERHEQGKVDAVFQQLVHHRSSPPRSRT